MAKFVSIKTLKRAQKIERNGYIKAYPAPVRSAVTDRRPQFFQWEKVIFAMPVTPNYLLSHQWIAEISRCYRHSPVSAIYFEIPDDEMVYAGQFSASKVFASAAEVCGYFYDAIQSDDISHLPGFEVQIPCDYVNNITRIKHRIKRVGWRRDPKRMATNLEEYWRSFKDNTSVERLMAWKYD